LVFFPGSCATRRSSFLFSVVALTARDTLQLYRDRVSRVLKKRSARTTARECRKNIEAFVRSFAASFRKHLAPNSLSLSLSPVEVAPVVRRQRLLVREVGSGRRAVESLRRRRRRSGCVRGSGGCCRRHVDVFFVFFVPRISLASKKSELDHSFDFVFPIDHLSRAEPNSCSLKGLFDPISSSEQGLTASLFPRATGKKEARVECLPLLPRPTKRSKPTSHRLRHQTLPLPLLPCHAASSSSNQSSSPPRAGRDPSGPSILSSTR